MERNRFRQIDLKKVKTPCFIVDEAAVERNLKILSGVKRRTGCRILLALKAFSMYGMFPLIRKYLDGICASSENEARLGYEEFGKEVHTFAPAYSQEGIRQIAKYSDFIIFNSFGQWSRHRDHSLKRKKKCGLRVNPEYSEIEVDLYDPCVKNSRLGVRSRDLDGQDLAGISGLHFHAMCQQNSDVLERILVRFERKFGKHLGKMEWVNFGGGHHITRDDYDIDLLVRLINDFKDKYGVEVIIEPGEAIALNAGILVSSVIDIIKGDMDIAILDTSAETHMPDVLAMPYRPGVIGAGKPGEYRYTYRLGGVTCLAGDVIGDYSFKRRLKPGDKLMFKDMAIYSMVKTTTFNGIDLPSIAVYTKGRKLKIVKQFGYEAFKSRL
ncbi:carboxynorspermidine decarboxylase [Candidatus Auribacterota bacterium]